MATVVKMKLSQGMALSELEGAALALLARQGPMTAYSIAATFAKSPSTFWSGSEGAVYPMLARMEKRGLVVPQTGATGKRSHKVYEVSHAGRVALKEWLLNAKIASGMGYDPLRTRMISMELVTAEERTQFLRDVKGHTKALRQSTAFASEPGADFVHQTWLKARLFWLQVLSGQK